MTESHVHVAVRNFLREKGWLLIAGQFPGGTDDELNVLGIPDPVVAKDSSPDPRRYGMGMLVPDLLAYKRGTILVVEAKPKYSVEDRDKLIDLLANKMARMILALKKFSYGKAAFNSIDYDTAKYIPVLAFGNRDFVVAHRDVNFVHIYVRDLWSVKLVYFVDTEDGICTITLN